MDQPTWIGRTLGGRYKIEAVLGQGGMSAVYKANDPNLKRVVAIKLIHAHLSTDPSFVQRFESEAAAVASLRHPNIVQVFDFNHDNGVYYMVLEFIPGETLQDRLKRLAQDGRRLPLEDALRFTLNISDAVGYAHQRGMVHRDIKPANIMLDMQGQAILMDFGIVKILGGDSHTSTGAVVGTARYMSPEIIRGESADHRADIYSLGVTLYEMLSGRPPFMADSAMTLMMMHLNDPVPNVRDFRADIPYDVARILEKCLAKERNNRYQSAAELSADLKRALAASAEPATVMRSRDTVLQDIPTQMESLPAPQAKLMPVPVAQSQSYPVAAPTTTTTIAPSPAQTRSVNRRWIWGAGAGLLVLCCVAVAILVRFSGNLPLAFSPATLTSAPTNTEVVLPTATNMATQVAVTAATPTETAIPLTATPATPYVIITSIEIANNKYVVNYEVHNFPDAPQLHVHMFFNTVSPAQAGMPGSGPWKLTWGKYGNPPFTQYGPQDRPANATQMCSLVANANHTVIQGTGNCMDLP